MTNQPKHTPGPWVLAGRESINGIIKLRINSNEGDLIAHTEEYPEYSKPIRDKVRANARLIAASPEMLEALEACKKELADWAWERYSDVEHWPTYQKVVAVIKKAKGE